MLNTFCAENKKDWDDYLPYLILEYRVLVHAQVPNVHQTY